MSVKRKAKVSTRERLAIVEEAIRLIRKPGTWTKGKWQCEIDQTRSGDPIYAFCLDGAVGYAALTVLGPRRAGALGVVAVDGIIDDGGDVGELLSIRRLAYEALLERGYFDHEHESDEGDSYHVNFNDDRKTTHRDVLDLLRRKARELRAAVKRLDARRAS